MNNLKQSIVDKIQCGDVQMRPRWHFVLLSLLFVIGLAILTIWLVCLQSFILFLLAGTGVLYVPMFGLQGITTFLLSAPWLLLLLTIVFLFLLHQVVCHYSFAYRKPLLYSAVGILGFTFVAAVIVAQSDIHYKLMEYAEADKLPVIGSVYKEYGRFPHSDVHVGVISSTTEYGYILRSRLGTEYDVVVTPETRVPKGGVHLEEPVLILGPDKNGVVEAVGIRLYNERQIKPKAPYRQAPAPVTP